MSKQATDANADFVAALNALENVSANKSNPAFKGSKYVSLDQLLDADRLGHVVVHARGQAFLAVALHGVGGHGDDARTGARLPLRGDAA